MMKIVAWVVIWFACLAASVLTLVVIPLSVIFGSGHKAWSLAISYDQLGNVHAGGYVDEMISAKAWRVRDRRRWVSAAIDWVFERAAGELNHCQRAYDSELRRLQLPPEYRSADY